MKHAEKCGDDRFSSSLHAYDAPTVLYLRKIGDDQYIDRYKYSWRTDCGRTTARLRINFFQAIIQPFKTDV